MADARSGKAAAAAGTKPARQQVDPEQRRLVLLTSRALWQVYHAGDDPKLDAEQRREDWKETRTAYVQMAAGLVRRLKAHGITLVQTTAPASKTAKPAAKPVKAK